MGGGQWIFSQTQFLTVLVHFVVFQSAERFFAGQNHFTAPIDIAMIVFFLVLVDASVVLAWFAHFRHGIVIVRDNFLLLVVSRVFFS